MLILGPLSFLIYTNDLSDDLITNVKLFAGNTALRFVAHDLNTFANNLNSDLSKINDWVIQLKMSKQAQSKQTSSTYIFQKMSEFKL